MQQSRWATAPDPKPSVPAQSQTDIPQERSVPTPQDTQTQTFAGPSQTVTSFDGSMDDFEPFAQTRPPDDLFSDEFEPISEPVIEQPSVPLQKTPSGPRNTRKGPRQHSNQKPTSGAQTANDNVAPADGPRKDSVRGDRSGTGGVKQAKLTEEELSRRMEAVRLKNQALEAAHARAEADEASYKAREAEDLAKRKLERQNQQQMLGERERNRLRKMNALGGREWDVEKSEEPQGGQYRRPADQGDQDLSQYIYDDNARGGQRNRGRGGGRGRGRGRGGGYEGFKPTGSAQSKSQSAPTANDFPSLPFASPPPTSEVPKKIEIPKQKIVPTVAVGTEGLPVKNQSWADEMDTPIEPQAST